MGLLELLNAPGSRGSVRWVLEISWIESSIVEQKTYQGDCEKTLPIYHPIYGNIYHPTINLSHPKCRAFHIPGFHGAYMAYNFCIYWWLENLDIKLSILPSKQQKQKTCGVLKRMNHVDWDKHVNIVQMNYTP